MERMVVSDMMVFEMRPSKNQFATGLASTIAIRIPPQIGSQRRLIHKAGRFSIAEANHLKSA
jgi:hypothetical protein